MCIKKLFVLAIISLLVFSGVPRLMNYQGKITDESGIGLNTTVPMTFELYSSETGEDALWSETQTVTITKGFFSVILGLVNEFPDSVDFSTQYWLQVVVDGESMSEREQLTSTPYSMRSAIADRGYNPVYSEIDTTRRSGDFRFRAGSGSTISDESGAINITIGNATLAQVLSAGNNGLGQQIKNIADPTDPQDAVTKEYADNISAEAGGVNTVTGGDALSNDGAVIGDVILDVNIDNATIGIDGTNKLYVKDDGITTTQILNGTISTADIGDGQITSAKIATESVGSDELAPIPTLTPGEYDNASITVNEDGRITLASDGAVSGLGGGGLSNYIAKFTDASTVGNSDLYNSDGILAMGTTSPDPSAMFVLSSTNKGVLIPRMSETERNSISSPALGLQIFNTTTNCFNFWMGSSWRQWCGECDFANPTLGSNSPLCESSTLNLTATSISDATYSWTGPGGFTSNAQNPSRSSITSSDAGEYTLRVTKDGCTGSPVSTVVTVNPLPGDAGTISGTSTVCQGQSGVSYSVSAISDVTGYTWNLPSGASIASGSNTNSITVDFSGSASSGNISVYGTNSCGSGEISPDYAVTVNSIPAAPVATAGSGASSNSITANWNASSGANGYRLDVSTSSSFGSFVSGYNNLDVGNVTSYNVTGLSGFTTYYYRIRAYNDCGTSSNSATISYSTLDPCEASGGWRYGGYCWREGAFNQSCNTICSSHGSCVQAGLDALASDNNCTVCRHYRPGENCSNVNSGDVQHAYCGNPDWQSAVPCFSNRSGTHACCYGGPSTCSHLGSYAPDRQRYCPCSE